MARCDILVTYYNTVFENTYFTFFQISNGVAFYFF